MSDRPKVVDVRVERKEGLIDTYHARVTLDDGTSATNWDTSEAAAIHGATAKANTRTSWTPGEASAPASGSSSYDSSSSSDSSSSGGMSFDSAGYDYAPWLLSRWMYVIGAALGAVICLSLFNGDIAGKLVLGAAGGAGAMFLIITFVGAPAIGMYYESPIIFCTVLFMIAGGFLGYAMHGARAIEGMILIGAFIGFITGWAEKRRRR